MLLFGAIVFLSLNVFGQTPCVRIVYVDPVNDLVTLQSFEETETIDMTAYSFCSAFACDDLSSLVVNFGQLNIPPGDSVQFVIESLADNAADIGLYSDSDEFFNPDFMVDFMQYQGSISLFNHATAQAKGIWTSGTYIDTAAPYTYYGSGCADNGVDFWANPNGLSSIELASKLKFAINSGFVEVSMSELNAAQIKLYDINGRLQYNNVITDNTHRLNTASLPSGLYFIQVLVDRAVVTKKVMISAQ